MVDGLFTGAPVGAAEFLLHPQFFYAYSSKVEQGTHNPLVPSSNLGGRTNSVPNQPVSHDKKPHYYPSP